MATNEEKTKVLAAQTPLASANGVDAIAVRRNNDIGLLEIGKLVPANAGGISCPWIQAKNKTIAEFKQMIAAFMSGKTEKVTSFSFSANPAWIENFDNDSYVIADGMMWTAIVDGIYTSSSHFSLSVKSYNQQRKFNVICNNGSWSIKEVVLADVGGVPTKAKDVDVENLKNAAMSVAEFKAAVLAHAKAHSGGAMFQASLSADYPQKILGENQSATLVQGATTQWQLTNKTNDSYWSYLITCYDNNFPPMLMQYYNGTWKFLLFSTTAVTG